MRVNGRVEVASDRKVTPFSEKTSVLRLKVKLHQV